MSSAIGVEDITGVAMISKYHFQRMFHTLTCFTVTEYASKGGLRLLWKSLSMVTRWGNPAYGEEKEREIVSPNLPSNSDQKRN